MNLLKDLLTVTLFSFVSIHLSSQTLVWADVFGANTVVSASTTQVDVATSTSGIIYSVGIFSGQTDLALGAADEPFQTILHSGFISAHDENGVFLWAKTIETSEGTSFLRQISVNSSNELIISGLINGTVDVDPGQDTTYIYGVSSGFTAKYDSDGNYVWSRIYDYSDEPNGYQIVEHAIDEVGNVYLVINFNDTLDLIEGEEELLITPDGPTGAAIIKVTPSGDIAWTKTISSEEWEFDATALSASSSGQIRLAGRFIGTVDFDPSENELILNSEEGNAFLLALDAEGEFLWVNQLGHAMSFVGNTAVHSDDSGATYLAVSYQESISIENETISSPTLNGYNAVIIMYNAIGEYEWAVNVSGAGYDYITDIQSGADGLVLIGHVTEIATITGNGNEYEVISGSLSGMNVQDSEDVFLLSLTETGTVNWACMWGGSLGGSTPSGLDILPSGQIVVGSFHTALGFDLDFTEDFLQFTYFEGPNSISVIDAEPVGINPMSTAQFNLYPNPSNGVVQIQTPDYMDYDEVRILNSSGQIVSLVPDAQRNGSQQLSLPASAGIYIVQLLNKGAVLASERVMRH